jgi:hypothetical protein
MARRPISDYVRVYATFPATCLRLIGKRFASTLYYSANPVVLSRISNEEAGKLTSCLHRSFGTPFFSFA